MKSKKQEKMDKEIKEIKPKTMKIKELKIEVEIEVHDKNKSFEEIIIPKGWRLLKGEEAIFLANNKKYSKKLKIADGSSNNDFFIQQPFNFNKKYGYVARFFAGSVWADLYCYGDPGFRDCSLGVRFCRDLKKGDKLK
jgi:hypothetical protein